MLSRSIASLLSVAAACAAPVETGGRRAPGVCTARPIVSARALLEDLGLRELRLEVSRAELRDQARAFGGEVCFERAVRAAVAAFALDQRDPEGPIPLLRRRPHRDCARPEAPEILLCYLRRPGARLRLGPGSRAAWRFRFHLPALSPRPFAVRVGRRPDPEGSVRTHSRGLLPD